MPKILTLMLKGLIQDYSWGKEKPIYIYRLGQRNCISRLVQVYVLSKLHRYIYKRQNFEWKKGMHVFFLAKLRKHKLLSATQ